VQRFALSYPLSVQTPYPDGGQAARVIPVSQLANGDISNTCRIEFWNHMGTHMDGPAHMTHARQFVDYCPPTGWVLNSVIVADIECSESQLIGPGDLSRTSAAWDTCELVLLRTGFSRYRQADPKRYCRKNPGINAELARWLAANCPRLVCAGLDTISFAAAEHLAEGIEAHKILFNLPRPVLLIEDLNLAFDFSKLLRVHVVPFFIEGVDSCPCTVIAENRSQA
jgi:kynurenine formamidase